MNDVLQGGKTFLDPVWTERVVRLRLGIAPVDPVGAGSRRLTSLECFSEDVPKPFRPRRGRTGIDHTLGLPRLHRTPSARHTVAFGTEAPARDRVVVRIVDRDGAFVPRRLSVPTPTLAQVEADDAAREADPTHRLTPRACRPVVFPSVRYGTPAGATIVRGRATWAATGDPARWARVTVWSTDPAIRPWLGHTDHQGEFVVFVGTVPPGVVQGGTTLDLALTVHTLAAPPPEDLVDELTAGVDPLKHLPVEIVDDLDPSDPVLLGTERPPGYVPKATVPITCVRGTTTPTIPVVLA